MMIAQELEIYLVRLEKALSAISVSERAEIITEIKGHVLEKMEQDPSQKLFQVLNSLGAPEVVAQKYLSDRGISATPKDFSGRSFVKWVLIGMFSCGALAILMIGLLIWKFTPFVKVDEAAGTVKILGGLIDVKEKPKGSSFEYTTGKEERIFGTKSIEANETIFINFTNGKLNLSASEDGQVKYDCKMDSEVPATIEKLNSVLSFDFGKSKGVVCDINLPSDKDVTIVGKNGALEFNSLKNNLKAELVNGMVEITEIENVKYVYDLKTMSGKVDDFVSSQDINAYKIKINVTNGMIRKE